MNTFIHTIKARWNYHMTYRPLLAAIDVSLMIGLAIVALYFYTNA